MRFFYIFILLISSCNCDIVDTDSVLKREQYAIFEASYDITKREHVYSAKFRSHSERGCSIDLSSKDTAHVVIGKGEGGGEEKKLTKSGTLYDYKKSGQINDDIEFIWKRNSSKNLYFKIEYPDIFNDDPIKLNNVNMTDNTNNHSLASDLKLEIPSLKESETFEVYIEGRFVDSSSKSSTITIKKDDYPLKDFKASDSKKLKIIIKKEKKHDGDSDETNGFKGVTLISKLIYSYTINFVE